jgi:hypothetical protein
MAAQLKPLTQTKYYPFNGGLDVVTPALSVDPGFALAMINYEPWYNGGYRRIDGYERFDGHKAPSAGTSYGLTISSLSGITGVGTNTTTNPNCYQPGTGVTSGATGIVTAAITVGGTSYLGITNIAGTFTTGEKIFIGTTTSTGTTLIAPAVGFSPGTATGTDGYTYNSEFLYGMANYYRQQIAAVPGTGNILAAWCNGTNTYAVRGTQTTVAGTNTTVAAGLWLASGTGWTQSGISYATTVYYKGLLSTVQSANFTATLDASGILNVTAMVSGTLYVGGTIADNNGLVPIGATILAQLGTATGQTGQYQLSVSPSIPVASETMFTLNPPSQVPTAGQVVVGATSSATGTVAYGIPHDTTVGYVAFSTAAYPGGTATFRSGEVLQTIIGGTATAWGTAAAAGTAFSLPVMTASGTSTSQKLFRFKNANFFGTLSTYNVYGVSGAGPAFEINQNNLVTPILLPLTTLPGQPGNGVWPYLVESYQGFLFLGYPGGIYEQSVSGQPLQFDGFLGAAEFSVGDELTGMFSIVGPNLILPTKHSSFALVGNSDANFIQNLVAEKAGAVLYSGQLLDTVYAINNLGITSLARTQSYGNFVGATVSQLIQPIITALRPNFMDSTIVRLSNQARFYFNDGSAIIMFVPGLGQQNKAWSAIESGVTAQFGYANYPSPVYCAFNSEDQNNSEVRFLGLTNGDGFVYHDGVGPSFDGAAVTSYVRLAFNNIGSPAVRKYFRRADLEINSTSSIALKFAYDLSFSSAESANSAIQNLTVANIAANTVFGGGGYWDSINWNQFYWDAQAISTARALLGGSGQNISFLIFHQAIMDTPFVLQGLTLYYDPRRLQR